MPRALIPCLVLAALVGSAVTSPAATTGNRPAYRPAVDQVQASEATKLEQQHNVALQMKYDAIWEGARSFFRDARERAELVRRARRGDRAAIRGLRVRRAGNDEGAPVSEALPAPAFVPGAPDAATATASVPANTRCNNPASDVAGAGQSEEYVAGIGDNLVVAWNNGQGFNTGGDLQGYGWSNDGGATFTDGGAPPHPGAYPSFRWTSDPVMTVNAKSGDYWYCGLAATDASHNAIAVARGRFTGGVFAFDSVFVVRICPNPIPFLDKEWVACDSTTGNVYVTNTTFGAADTVDFYRSTDGGRSWSSPIQLSSNADAGYIQGSRVVVAPNGDIETAWYASDQVTNDDDLRFRRSTDHGASFTSEVTAAKFFAQFGTGAPGFNRERGITFPSLAVDNSTGAHRGRIYLAWHEANAFLNLALPVPAATSRVETEPNSTSGTASAFTPGQILRGTLATTGGATLDQDWYSFPLSAGQTFVTYCDSMSTGRGWYLRLLAPDGVQRLCFGGKPDSTSGSNYAYYSFTAPVSGTYFLRLISTSYRTIGYRILTGIYTPGSERSRDQGDAFVAWSDNSVAWSTPARANDDAIGYDQFLTEVAVGADGSPYTMWFDHRDDTYGSRANVYLTRSTDGGATWVANQKITSVQSNFTTSPANIAPNMGDYSGIAGSGTRIVPSWADGRLTSGSGVDVWATSVDVTSAINTCPADTTMNAPGTASFGWTVANHDVVFGGTYGVTVTSQRAWPLSAPSTIAIPAGSSAFYSADVTVPDTAATGPNVVCLTLTSPGGVVVGQCCYTVHALGNAAGVTPPAPGQLALARSRPNPAFGQAVIAFALPQAGHARLTVYDLAGARVRTLVDGERPAGQGTVTWDGRDDHGARAHAGAYFYRLEFGGRTLSQRLVLMR